MTLETPDVDRALAHYTDIVGLVVTDRSTMRCVLSSILGEELIVLERGVTPRVKRVSLQISPAASLGEARRYLSAAGIACELRHDITPSLAEVATFVDPSGTDIELFTDARHASDFREARGVAPLKLGHVAFTVASAKIMVDFYTEKFGFRVSDWIGNFFAFLRCGPDHHTLNFINGNESRLHHIAFELKDWSHIQSACELLGRKARKIIWGPGRHGVGHNVFVYHRDEDDHIVEFYIEMDQMKDEALGYFERRPWHKDHPQRPKVWDAPAAALTWGPPPTEDFLRSHPVPRNT